MRRREFVTTVAGTGSVALAGCLDGLGIGGSTSGREGDELVVGTYSSFVDAPSTSPGDWIKEQFESEFDATLTWLVPESGLNNFILRRQKEVSIDADVYVGLNADDLVRIDRELPDKALFRETDTGGLENYGAVRDDLKFDPEGRAIPFDTGYISLVYDENEVENPETFDTLTTSEYEGTLLAQNAQSSDPGQAFMLWTVKEFGPDGYLDYWRDLVANDVRILGDWDAAYGAYSNGERPIVVSYSTDQVYANRYDQDMSRHQVGFLNDQGYANPEGMAVFETTDAPDLAEDFLDFMLTKKVQSEIPIRNVQFPATTHADPGEEFEQYAHEPPEPVTHTYDELEGNLGGWVEDWAREIAES